MFLVPKASLKSLAKINATAANSFAMVGPSKNNISFAEPVKNFVNDSPELTLVQENSLAGVCSPVTANSQTLGILLDDDSIDEERKEILEYAVEAGDTISSIAAKFSVSVNTILWANNLKSKSLVKVGDKLIIPPVSGIIYHVKKNDTIGGVAKTLKAEANDIVAFNELANENDIYIGDILVVPGGTMPTASSSASGAAQIPVASSYFICPRPTCKITQGLHWYNAVDIDGECGDLLYAAAGGKVLKIRYGWNGGGGNYIEIIHPNGVITYYGHIITALVSEGQEVSQGDSIALMGGKPGTPGSGISTGCHVHFGVIGATNPFAR